MKRRITGLAKTANNGDGIADGVYLVSVQAAQYRWDKQKPYYLIRFAVVQPETMTEAVISGRLYTTPKALWKLSWFLRDFGYPPDLLERDELDERELVGLRGVLKVAHAVVDGRTYLNLDAFAPAESWVDNGGQTARESSSEVA